MSIKPARLGRLLAATLLTGCGANPSGTPPSYSDNDLVLVTRFAAKTMCSCVFVMLQTDAYCALYAKQAPAVATFRVDKTKKTVAASALFLWSGRAHFVNAQEGCVLE